MTWNFIAARSLRTLDNYGVVRTWYTNRHTPNTLAEYRQFFSQ